MESLQGIKQRIKLVNSVKKITHAMELVSTAKMRRSKNNFMSIQAFDSEMKTTFNKIIAHLTDTELAKIFSRNTAVNSYYIVISSDLGLAGAYNSNIFKLSLSKINKNDSVVIFGHKADHFFKSKHYKNVLHSYSMASNDIDYNIIREITKEALDLYHKNEIKDIRIIYTKFVNNLVQNEIEEMIFPIVKDKNQPPVEQNHIIEFDPNTHSVLNSAFPLYISNYIYTSCISAKLSENASRRTAMENATNNADDIIEKLSLEFNRKRQSIITQELNEIVAGADAV